MWGDSHSQDRDAPARPRGLESGTHLRGASDTAAEARLATATDGTTGAAGAFDIILAALITAVVTHRRNGGMNHRLFCLLIRDAEDLGGSSIVCLGGLSKPRRERANPRDYRRIKMYREEFERHRKVLS